MHPDWQLTSVAGKSPYAPNIVRNQKYTIVSFLPIVLWEQFQAFYNLYFLLVALSQFIPAFKIGERLPLLLTFSDRHS